MKKCKYCLSAIDINTKFCPHCGKKQGMPIWGIILIVITVFMVIGSFGTDSSEGSSKNKPTGETVEDITLLDGHTGKVESNYSYEITGTIQNNNDSDYSFIEIEFYTYDKDGNMLDTCFATNSGLEANGKWKFTATCFFYNGNAKKVKSYKLKDITKW